MRGETRRTFQTRSASMSKPIRIYLADLAAYNAGHLHGVWVEATQPLHEIQTQIESMLRASPVPGAEEYAIHDHEGFDGYRPGEYESLQAIHEIACLIEAHPGLAGALLAYFGEVEAVRAAIKDNYCGCYPSLADYAQDVTEQTTDIPAHLAPYIDYQAMARDMEYGGDVFTIETGFEQVHVFRTY
jgi:antirestriction protein